MNLNSTWDNHPHNFQSSYINCGLRVGRCVLLDLSLLQNQCVARLLMTLLQNKDTQSPILKKYKIFHSALSSQSLKEARSSRLVTTDMDSLLLLIVSSVPFCWHHTVETTWRYKVSMSVLVCWSSHNTIPSTDLQSSLECPVMTRSKSPSAGTSCGSQNAQYTIQTAPNISVIYFIFIFYVFKRCIHETYLT